MFFQRTAARVLFVSIGATAILAGCAATPMAPTVQVSPGRGKSMDQFAVDNSFCRQYASDQVQGSVNSANSQAVAAMLMRDEDDSSPPVLGVSMQNNIQAEYDGAFGRCMFANHNIVPGYAMPRIRTARPAVHRATPAAANASASAPGASTWVQPTTSTSSASSSSGASGWVAPKTQ
jgi:hypothetical protein